MERDGSYLVGSRVEMPSSASLADWGMVRARISRVSCRRASLEAAEGKSLEGEGEPDGEERNGIECVSGSVEFWVWS